MNYKVIIVLFIIILLIILTYREITTLKSYFFGKLNSITSEVAQVSDETNTKIQSSIGNCISQFKNISINNLQELRKITLLNKQPITKVVNHFTETDPSYKGAMTDNPLETSDLNILNQFNNNDKQTYYMSSGKNKEDEEDEEDTFDIPIYVKEEDYVESIDENLMFPILPIFHSFSMQLPPSPPVTHSPAPAPSPPPAPAPAPSPPPAPLSPPPFVSLDEQIKNLSIPTLTQPSETKSKYSVKTDIPFELSFPPSLPPSPPPSSTSLNPISSFTIKELKNMAKELNLPLTYKKNNKIYQYNKSELYDLIKKNKK